MSTSNPARGLNTDALPRFQPEGTYRFALNSTINSDEFAANALNTELGNELKVENFPSGKKIIGHVLNDKDEAVLFIYDPEGDHEVGIYSPIDSTYTPIYVSACLNFSLEHPVNALFRVRNGCESVVYFTDNYNRYRVLNLSDPPDTLNCNLINHSPDYTHPCISLKVTEGDTGVNDANGNLQIGTYSFAFRYLDKDRNPSDFFILTRPVAVGNEPYNTTVNAGTVTLYDGGVNTDTSPYYVPRTSKSIIMRLTNLDYNNWSFYQIAVIKRTGDNGEITGVDILNEVPIDGPTDNRFEYTGFDTQVKLQSSLEEILSTKLKVDKVKAHAQLDNILYIGNTSSSVNRDYSTYQRYASKIKVEWAKDDITSPVDAFNKQANYYFQSASFMEDEIYALGIVFVHDDGTLSPAFHIPGRPPNVVTGDNPYIGTAGVPTGNAPWDTGLAFYGDLFNSGKNARFQNMSTATKLFNSPLRGEMGYHEALNATYPEIPTCDNHPDGYWGRDWNGELIDSSVKIRHHRMPGPELRDTAELADGFRVGLRFTNIEYPPGVVRHYFVYCNDEPTILAKGVLIPLYTRPDSNGAYVFDPKRLQPEVIGVPGPPLPSTVATFAFLSPENILYPKYYNPRYFRLEKFINELEFNIGLGANTENSIVTIKVPNQLGGSDTRDLDISTSIYNYTTYELPGESFNYIVSSTYSLPKANYGTSLGTRVYDPINTKEVENRSLHLSPQILIFNRQIADWIDSDTPDNQIAYGSIKVDIDPYINLFSLKYKRITTCPDRAVSTSSVFTHYGGDTFTSRVNVVDFSYKQESDGDPDTEEKYIDGYFMGFLSQSTKVNYEFRHGSSTEPKYSYYKWNYKYDSGHRSFANHLGRKYYELTADLMEMHLENYSYNPSYSYINSLQEFLPPVYENFCNYCIENSPYRVHYSQMDNVDQSVDAYRIFRPLSYRDSDTQYGPIVDLFVSFGNLYLLTAYQPFLVPTQPQTIFTNENEVYLGTAAGLPNPFRPLKSSEQSFGGSESFLSRTLTQYGAFYMDSITGRPFLINPQLNDLSVNGMSTFFLENARLELLLQFKSLTGKEYGVITTTSPIGVGYISTYDPRYRRLIVTKRDYKITPSWENRLVYLPLSTDDFTGETLEADSLYFNNFNWYTTDSVGTPTKVDFSHIDIFENKSFTISYSFDSQSWVSFHSYIPTYMFHTSRTFYSNEIYEHGSRPHLQFYGITYPQIIDLSLPNQGRGQVSSIYYTALSKTFDASSMTYAPYPQQTFNGLWIYNSNQSSGFMGVQFKDQPFEQEQDSNLALVSHIDNTYRINSFRDLTVNQNIPISTSSWNVIATSPFDYIDKVPNQSNLDVNKSMFEQSRFADYFTGLRLYYYPSTVDTKISLDVISTMTKNKIR